MDTIYRCVDFKFHLNLKINLVISSSPVIINYTGLDIVSLLCVPVSKRRPCNHGSGL